MNIHEEKVNELNAIVAEKNRLAYLERLISNPELNDFLEGVRIEQAHQTERWGRQHEERSPPHHYILVLSKLMGKLAVSIFDRDEEKFRHHLITMAATCFNAFRQIGNDGTEINRWFKK